MQKSNTNMNIKFLTLIYFFALILSSQFALAKKNLSNTRISSNAYSNLLEETEEIAEESTLTGSGKIFDNCRNVRVENYYLLASCKRGNQWLNSEKYLSSYFINKNGKLTGKGSGHFRGCKKCRVQGHDLACMCNGKKSQTPLEDHFEVVDGRIALKTLKNFKDCKNIKWDGGDYFYARVKNNNGDEFVESIRFFKCLGNNNGKFERGAMNFGRSSRNCKLVDGHFFTCDLRTPKGSYNNARIDLNDVISNNDGYLNC